MRQILKLLEAVSGASRGVFLYAVVLMNFAIVTFSLSRRTNIASASYSGPVNSLA